MKLVEVAQYGAFVMLGMSVLFHLLILFKVISYKIVWGGRLKSDREMYRFEAVSITVNLALLTVMYLWTIDQPWLSETFFTICFWSMFGLFLLNTLGNLFSKSMLERLIFTPITAVLAACAFILALYG